MLLAIVRLLLEFFRHYSGMSIGTIYGGVSNYRGWYLESLKHRISAGPESRACSPLMRVFKRTLILS